MLASVLNSPQAVAMSIHVVEAFVRLRQLQLGSQALTRRLSELERRLDGHDVEIQSLLLAIRKLIDPPPLPEQKKRRIGFGVDDTERTKGRKK